MEEKGGGRVGQYATLSKGGMGGVEMPNRRRRSVPEWQTGVLG